MSAQQKPRVRLGDVVVNAGLVTREQVAEALEYQKLWGHRLGTALVAKKFITEFELIDVLARELRLDTADPLDLEIPREVLALVPKEMAAAQDLIPIAIDERQGLRRIVVVMADPLNIDAISVVRAHCRMDVLPVIGAMSSVAKAIHKHYGVMAAVNKVSAYADGELVIVHKGGDEVKLGADGKMSEKLAATKDPFAHLNEDQTAPGAKKNDDTTHVPKPLQYPGQAQPAQPSQDISTWRPPALQYPGTPPSYPPQAPAYAAPMPGYPQPMYPQPGYPAPMPMPNPMGPPMAMPQPQYPGYGTPGITPNPTYAAGAATYIPAKTQGFSGIPTPMPGTLPAMPQGMPAHQTPGPGGTFVARPGAQNAAPPPPPPQPPATVSAKVMDELSSYSPKELLLAVIRVLVKKRIVPADDLLEELKRRS